MELKYEYHGNFKRTGKFLDTAKQLKGLYICSVAGKEGVAALEKATPKDTGKTANNWYYEVEDTKDGFKVTWCNANVHNGANIAILLQYGHGTKQGGFVEGTDYINPALKPVFDNIAEKAFKNLIGGVVRNVI